jgi:hypothetical protein
VVSDISETLRKEKGYPEIAEKEDGNDQADGVLPAHSRSTPFTISAVTAKNATVRITNTRSSMRSSSRQVAVVGHPSNVCPNSTLKPLVNNPLTPNVQMLTRS